MLILLACIDHDAVFLTRLSIVKALGDAYYAWRPKRGPRGRAIRARPADLSSMLTWSDFDRLTCVQLRCVRGPAE